MCSKFAPCLLHRVNVVLLRKLTAYSRRVRRTDNWLPPAAHTQHTNAGKRPPDKKPPRWFFTMRKLARQTIESNFHDFYARTLSHAVYLSFFACDVKPATTEQHLLMTRSSEYRKIQQTGLNELEQQDSVNSSYGT